MRRRWGLYILHLSNPDYAIYSGQWYRGYRRAALKAETLNTALKMTDSPYRYRVSRVR